MVTKINTNFNYINRTRDYLSRSAKTRERTSKLRRETYDSVCEDECVCAKTDMFVKRPVKNENSAGLLSFKSQKTNVEADIFVRPFGRYKNNIKHTIEHKYVYAKVERNLYGKNSINSITHDSDKLLLYLLGFSHNFVSKAHRKISEHHVESGKKLNLESMLCDIIASSPYFKPEKKLSLREFYQTSPELQNVVGFGDILERYNYGDEIDFNKIGLEKQKYIDKWHKIKKILFI